MSDFQREKQFIRTAMQTFDNASLSDLPSLLSDMSSSEGYHWRGMHPFYEIRDPKSVAINFWQPLRTSLKHMQRREDIFFAGHNVYGDGYQVWTCSMGHFMGLFDEAWLNIPPTRKVAFLPYAEFHHLDGDKIIETALFVDIIRLMQQAGLDPIPTQTAAKIIQPGPRTLDGLCLSPHDPEEAKKTLQLLEIMTNDLNALNVSGNDQCSPELLAKTWHDDMLWYGPAGIGTTFTIKRYQEQHQYPFREQLGNKRFNGHIARFAEGNYAGWFGWPNLNNRNRGGFLGLPPSDIHAEMRVVDIYRREGDKLAENWVFIDLLYYLIQHGVDLLEDPTSLHG